MILRGHSWLVYAIWATLLGAAAYAVTTGHWQMGFVALATLAASLVPAFVADRYALHLPVAWFAGLVLFLFATIFLGEAVDFYERFWWWDIALHALSAIGMGLVGVILALLMFEGDRYAAPAWAVALVAFTFAMTIGVLWEFFEFSMDAAFGFNMQKSGLDDTMSDLMTDAFGGLVSAWAGYAFLRGRDRNGLAGQIAEFVAKNRWVFPNGRARRGPKG